MSPRHIIRFKFLGFATCWTRPWWKFWIRIYRVYLDDGGTDVICTDCRNVCDNFEIWWRF